MRRSGRAAGRAHWRDRVGEERGSRTARRARVPSCLTATRPPGRSSSRGLRGWRGSRRPSDQGYCGPTGRLTGPSWPGSCSPTRSRSRSSTRITHPLIHEHLRAAEEAAVEAGGLGHGRRARHPAARRGSAQRGLRSGHRRRRAARGPGFPAGRAAACPRTRPAPGWPPRRPAISAWLSRTSWSTTPAPGTTSTGG